jgi:hypothetical protein
LRQAEYASGTALTAYGIYQSGARVSGAIAADVAEGTMGQQTAAAVAHEAGGWAAAIYLGSEGAALGALTGPLAWIFVPVGGLVGGFIGYYAGSTLVDNTVYAGKAGIDAITW